jgi:ABC-2 type transport system permease protein
MALIAFVLLLGGSFTREFEHETLVLVLTKGLARYKIVLAKAGYMLSLWTLGYWICFAITYGYNAYFWDNGIATGLMPAALYFWVLGLLVTAIVLFFSVLGGGYGVTLVSSGACVLLLYLLTLIPKLSRISPFALSDVSALVVGAEAASAFFPALLLSIGMTLLLIGLTIPILNKKQL